MSMLSVAVASFSAAMPQGPHLRSTNAFMGHKVVVDYYAAGERYLSGDHPDLPKLERDVLSSRLKMYSTRPRPEFEKQQARRPRCAHCAPSFARSSQLCARPSSAHIGPALRAPVLCAHWPSSAHLSVPQEAALHISKENRSKRMEKYSLVAFRQTDRQIARWVKPLLVASTSTCVAVTGLSLILGLARILKPDMVSLLALHFASLFGLMMKAMKDVRWMNT